MNRLDLAVQTIKESVSAIDVANVLGWEIRHGRCKCPVHGGTDYNCRLYPGDRGYVCWVCKSGGDVVRLVQESIMKGATFKDVLVWFNDTFGLGLDLESTITPEQRRQAEKAQRMRKEAIEFQQWKDRMKLELALCVDRILEKLEEQRDIYAPKTKDEPWDSRFCEAVRLTPAARKFAEKCMADCIEERK